MTNVKNMKRQVKRARTKYADVLDWLAHYDNPKDDCACPGCREARAEAAERGRRLG